MKFTLGWLQEHIDTKASATEVAAKLTALGLEIEGLVDRAKGLESFRVAKVLEAKPHPNADRLQICRVDFGGGEAEVVCGASNARTGMKAVFAAAGSYIPGLKVTLKAAAIRGVQSNGMLLSEREMGLSDAHEGIVDLPADAPVGAPAVQIMGLADPVIDVAVTPNRGDCLGIHGIARDLAAAGVGTLKRPTIAPVPGGFASPIDVRMELDAAHAAACPYFVGRLIRGATNGESPAWLKDRLLAIGLRPISALVDITNIVMIGFNRPLHAFDADKLAGGIRVRMARPGERLLALNGKDYALKSDMTVIADTERPQALGGIIGGESSGCTATTQNVFFESALFDPVRTAISGRTLGILSDARYRFERGVDPAFVTAGIELATRLVLDLCGGEPSNLVVAGAEPKWQRQIAFRPSRVKSLGGVDIAEAEIRRILGGLGFTIDGGANALQVAVPSWRPDIVGEACLVEEVVRVHGYDRVPTISVEKSDHLPKPALDGRQRRRGVARRTLAARGLMEAVTYSFMGADTATLFGGGQPAMRLVNPIASDLDAMRPSILPNLIAAARRNAERGVADIALFEIGPQYAGDKPEDQSIAATGIRAGRFETRSWTAKERPVDVLDAKADALAVVRTLGVSDEAIEIVAEAPAWYHQGRSGTIRLKPKTTLGTFGEIHPGVLTKLDAKGPMVGFEILVDAAPEPKRRAGRGALKLSPYQPVERDFAFVVDATVAAGAALAAARRAEPGLISEVRLFDVFEGGALGAGKKSLAITVVLRPTDRTLTDAEIETVSGKVVAAVQAATGGVLRS